MPVCPRGHPSDTDDFCDECGLPMGGAPASPSSSSPSPPSPSSAAPAPAGGPSVAAGSGGDPCPWCGTPRTGRFCEEDGYDFALAPAGPAPGGSASSPSAAAFPSGSSGPSGPSAPSGSASSALGAPTRPPPPAAAVPSGWTVRIEADRRYYDSVLARRGPDIAAVTFPTYYPSTEVVLDGAEVRIGRRRASGTSKQPDIDLTGPPLDLGVSHLHAVLLAGPSGWSVLDPGSTNGTTINYADEPIEVDTPVPVADGDRIHVGAYTTLVITRVGR